MEVTLSLKRAKNRTRGRKRNLTGAKARVGRAYKTRADLEQQLKACRREIARTRERLAEAMKQQTATSEVMRIISSSPIQSVLDIAAENAARLCEANNAEIFRLENNVLRLMASYGEIPVNIQAREGIFANRERVIGRAVCDRRTVQVRNLAAEENEFPAGSSDAKREGHRTTLATPLLREGTPIGVILMRRWKIRPFSAKQIALLENFADQAAIAIENSRLFEAEKQRALALHKSEEALRGREKELRDILETIPAMTVTVLPDGSDVFIGKRYVEYSGLSADKGRRSGWKATAHPDDVDEHVSKWRSSLVSGEPIEIETRFRRADGEYRWFLARAAPLRDDEGKILNWYEVLTDIEDRKRAEMALRDSEEALRRSEAYLAEAQQLSQTGSVAYNDTFNLHWSGETYRILGFDPLEGLPSFEAVLQRLHPDDRERFVEVARRGVREKTDYKIEFRIKIPGGNIKHIELAAHPKFSSDGKFIEVVGTLIDVTARKRAQEERERLHQLETELAHVNRLSMMGELAASLAHEIKQPIAAARNNACAAMNFLDKKPPDLGEVREALDCIVGDADRAGNIIGRVRDQVKKAPPREGRFDLNEAIKEVMMLARGAITKNAVSDQIGLAESALFVTGDRVQVQQVLLNLALNAIEALGSVQEGPRELSITSEQTDENGVLVAVRDSGPGIDTKHLERVFEAFYTTKSSGLGMGLPICRSIIDAHGGQLWAEANEPRGAVFQFTLPGVENELTNPASQSHPP
jgi:PAS domain S-box-containing protein